MPAAQIAVAVVSWNTSALLDACLASLRPDAESGLAEVWVVDNASTDDSAAMVRQQHPWARLIELPRNVGYGAAVGEVARRTTTPFLLAANSDLKFDPRALGELLKAATQHPGGGVFAPRLLTAAGTTQHSVHPFPTIAVGLATSTGLARWGPLARRMLMEGHWDPSIRRTVPWAHGAAMLIPREAWDEATGFDPEQWLYAEDLDLCWRLAQLGRPTWFIPAAIVEHHVSAATAQRWDQRERLIRTQASSYAWIAHRQGLIRARLVAAANIAGLVPRWLLAAALQRLPGRRDGHAAAVLHGYLVAHLTGFQSAAKLERSRRDGGLA